MIDKAKVKRLASIMINYSVAIKKDEKLLIRAYGFECYPLIKELYKEAISKGAIQVDVRFSDDELARIFYEEANEKQLKYLSDLDLNAAKNYDAMIQIIADTNPFELAHIDIKKVNIAQKARKPISDALHKKKWCLFYYPTTASAHIAKRSVEEWQDFVLDSCLIDWKKEKKLQEKFIKLIKNVKNIRVVGKETDLTVNVKGQKWIACHGDQNLPDGEMFTSPVRNGVNGVIRYNVPTHYQSRDFDWVKLTIKDGKVIKEESTDTKSITKILNSDPGARYFGEFAFGLNNKIKKGTRQIIFDEKMGKSLHMALGKCYDVAPNGNDSNIHWDLIFNFLEAKAEIYFDKVKVFSKNKWIDKRFRFLN